MQQRSVFRERCTQQQQQQHLQTHTLKRIGQQLDHAAAATKRYRQQLDSRATQEGIFRFIVVVGLLSYGSMRTTLNRLDCCNALTPT